MKATVGRPKRYLLLAGSPRGSASTSEALGMYLLEQLHSRGGATERLRLHSAMRSEAARRALLVAFQRADVVILCAPLYVDSLPATVIRALELLRDELEPAGAAAGRARRQRQLVGLINCGFPEPHHADLALAQLRLFAERVGLRWAGGLSLGMGEAIAGRRLQELELIGRHPRAALQLTAAALVDGEGVPEEAQRRMARRLVPRFLYVVAAHWGWRRSARRHGVRRRHLSGRPYVTGEAV